MNDNCNIKTGIILDGRTYEILEYRYGCYATTDANDPRALNEYFTNADAEDVGTILLKRYRRNERIIQESAL